jgi:heme/copper-type cytochrome/quinol oxidase subunit 2
MVQDPLFILEVIACLMVAVILIRGIATFGKEGVENAKRSNRFMQLRLIAQFVAIIVIVMFVYFRRQGG